MDWKLFKRSSDFTGPTGSASSGGVGRVGGGCVCAGGLLLEVESSAVFRVILLSI